jgi:hypothetical protein
MKHTHPHPWCPHCNAYLVRRADVLPAAVTHYAERRDMDPGALLVEFVRGVHKRHLAGLSLAT